MAETQNAATVKQREAAQAPTKGPIGLTLSLFGALAGFLITSLFLAIGIEWVGMVWWWPGQGMVHAKAMMEREVTFLSEDFRASLFASHPAVFARECADLVYYWVFEWTGIVHSIHWLKAVPADHSIRATLHTIYAAIEPFVMSAIIMTETFTLRVAVLIMSIPIFVLFGAVGMAEGLMRRDLRRWGGGRESSLAHGMARASVMPLLVSPWMIYLSLPFSLHPTFVIMPAAIAFGVAICIMSATFKKYL